MNRRALYLHAADAALELLYREVLIVEHLLLLQRVLVEPRDLRVQVAHRRPRALQID